jgi:hypothetical protein
VFARDIERSIEINFSCIAGSSWVSLPSRPKSWSRRPWQTLNRFERRVMSFGEYDESVSAFFTMPLSLSIVWVICSRSFDEYRFTSRRCSKSNLMVDVRAYAAGASLFLPIVMKKRESSWKHPSKTRSTAKSFSQQNYVFRATNTDIDFPLWAYRLVSHSVAGLAQPPSHIEP